MPFAPLALERTIRPSATRAAVTRPNHRSADLRTCGSELRVGRQLENLAGGQLSVLGKVVEFANGRLGHAPAKRDGRQVVAFLNNIGRGRQLGGRGDSRRRSGGGR